MSGTPRRVVNIYKYRGETPLECLRRLQEHMPELRTETLTYAGRLDPLAEGVLLVLVGEESMRKELYLALRKSYCVEVLFGFATDSYDISGKLTDVLDARVPMLLLMDKVARLTGTFAQPYPPYSSKPVAGKPLFWWAREGRLGEIEIPTHEVTIYKSLLRHMETLSGAALSDLVESSLSLLTGDFRQADVRACWSEHLATRRESIYDVATLEIECGSGTYMRSLSNELGRALHTPALALRIVRTAVGTHTLAESLRGDDVTRLPRA